MNIVPFSYVASRTNIDRLSSEFDFSRMKSATKYLYVKIVSGKVVRHSLAYLIVRKWFVGDPFYLKIWPKLTNPFQKRRLPIDIRS